MGMRTLAFGFLYNFVYISSASTSQIKQQRKTTLSLPNLHSFLFFVIKLGHKLYGSAWKSENGSKFKEKEPKSLN